ARWACEGVAHARVATVLSPGPVWRMVATVTLSLWPSKWPQHTLSMTQPLCLAAAATARWLYRVVKTDNPYWNTIEILLPRPTRAVWVILTVFVAALVIGRVAYEVQMTQARAGWTQATVDTSPLPSNTVNDIATGRDGTLALATGGGVVLWKPTRNAPWGETQEPPLYTPATAGLPAARVLAVLQAGDGAWWFGTDEGLARFDAVAWSVYRAGDMKLPGASVHALHQDATGRIWVGTLSGVARWDGATWRAFTQQPHGLLDNAVFAIASQGDVVWFGSLDGISRFDVHSGQWQGFNLGTRTLGWRGVTDLTVAADGKLWAATQGGGLGYWDGADWQFYRTSNSGIPYNLVNRVVEGSPGVLWLAFGFPTEPGGVVARYDGKTWQTFSTHNSGFSGHEPLALARDASGRLWIGTAAGGIQIFEPP
ncbi:MAG: hypothetical protein M1546_02965, partial [Chloroflexi bacterium]|nr:hypothetical protein [Chloroflexota bacterium]